MKYAFLFLALSFSFSTLSLANTINSFNDSQAIATIAQFMNDNAEDMPVSVAMTDKKLKLKDSSTCTTVTSAEVLSVVETAIKSVLRLYPDEELPIEEALTDLTDYVGPGPLKKCNVVQINNHKNITSVYFFDSQDKVHVKVDTITLTQ
ncbi:MAG: hypothetical protein H7281_19620 [Bacteriovorax sp.]|nr:hypothetical protein [Bacteriovorax sp.]